MIRFLIATLLLGCSFSTCLSFTNLVYTDNRLSAQSYTNQSLIDDIAQHHDSIQILAPQTYTVNESGTVWGSVSPRALKLGKRYHIKIMPLVMNTGFDREKLHQLLHNATAQKRAIAQLILLCQKNKYMGIQFDIENLSLNDKSAYTKFVKTTAHAFHQNQLKLSATVLYNQSTPLLKTSYAAWFYDNWSGGYDIKALAKACDFITIMAYDRHTSLTTPGPIAPLPWVADIIKNTLNAVAPNKILLGIPFYSGYWNTTTKTKSFRSREHQISYESAVTLQQQYHTAAKWNPKSATSSAIFHHPDGLYSYLYVQDARSVEALLSLAKKYKLRGIAAWQLGLEDPKVWPALTRLK